MVHVRKADARPSLVARRLARRRRDLVLPCGNRAWWPRCGVRCADSTPVAHPRRCGCYRMASIVLWLFRRTGRDWSLSGGGISQLDEGFGARTRRAAEADFRRHAASSGPESHRLAG